MYQFSLLFPSFSTVEMIDSLTEKFKTRFNDFRSHATNTSIFKNPLSVEVSDVTERKKTLTELQHDSILCGSFN
jgi:acyl carrier protein